MDLDTLRELRAWETEERIRRLEARDLEQAQVMERAEHYVKWLNRGIWIGAGLLAGRVAQEGGAELLKTALQLVTGG